MKKLFTLALVLLSVNLLAQTEVGVKVGTQYTIASGDLKSDFGSGKARFQAGIFSRENKGKVNFIIEGLYNNILVEKGAARFNIHAFNIPILLETNTGKFRAQAGFNTAINTFSKGQSANETEVKIKGFNIYGTAGVLFNASDRIGVNVRYHYPLFNASNEEDIDYRPMNVSLALNYRLARFE